MSPRTGQASAGSCPLPTWSPALCSPLASQDSPRPHLAECLFLAEEVPSKHFPRIKWNSRDGWAVELESLITEHVAGFRKR